MAHFVETHVDFRWHCYRIPLQHPIVTAHGVLTVREGAIVELVSDSGSTGLGEIAPLPWFGQSLEEALAPLAEIAAAFRHREHSTLYGELAMFAEIVMRRDLPRATRCGLHMVMNDALDKYDGRIRQGRAVPLNALVGAVDSGSAATAARAAVAAGYHCIKLKVGISDDPAAEIARIATVRDAIGPEIHLRLDANEAWNFTQAVDLLTQAAHYDIQYVEQPLSAADLAGMRQLREVVPVPIAADEAMMDLASAWRVLDAEAADVLVLKPQCAGDPGACLAIRRAAAAHGVECVVTSAIETGVGVAAALHLAAADPSITLECGLATLDLLADDLIVVAPQIEQGMMLVPEGPGLGVELDYEALDRYAVS